MSSDLLCGEFARHLINDDTVGVDEQGSGCNGDAESEREVQKALDEVLPGRTSLTIAHRLATVLRAEKIVVMDQGAIVEQGTHAQLMDEGGLYARLAKLQFT